jgi:uncharacterized cupin superfamily protein
MTGARRYLSRPIGPRQCIELSRAVPGRAHKRYDQRLGHRAGLSNGGVNLTRALLDGRPSTCQAHSRQGEFVYVLEGELLLVTDGAARL